MVLTAVISQVLLMSADHKRRVLAYEVLIAGTAIRNLIRERQLQQIYSAIQTGRDEGMITLNESLCKLVKSGVIDAPTALDRSARPLELERMLGGT
jgi:twitching motility protein PilT